MIKAIKEFFIKPKPAARQFVEPPMVVEKRMYSAAITDRLNENWNVSVTSANAEIMTSRKRVIAKMRVLERDNGWMEKALKIWTNNVIGHKGVQLDMQCRKARGTLDQSINERVEEAWQDYCERENCSASRRQSALDLQDIAVRSGKRDGGVLFRERMGDRWPYGFALQEIEIDRLDHDYNIPLRGGTNEVRFGIELDEYEAHIAYHVLTRHPGEMFAWMVGGNRTYRERIPANEIIAFWDTLRANQFVGMPAMTGCIKLLSMLGQYAEAEVVAAYLASCKSGFIEKTNPDVEYTGSGKDAQGNKTIEIQPGMIEELPAFSKYVANDPNHPTDAYPDFVKTTLREIASSAGVPYNDLANDLEGVNFSSIRSGLLEAREGYKRHQVFVRDHLMRPWFRAWVPFAIMSGKLKVPMSEVERIQKSDCWIARRWPWVDPLKDVQAKIEALNAGLVSKQQILDEMEEGYDLEETYEQLAEEKEMADEHGLDFDAANPKPKLGSKEDGEGAADTSNGNGNGNGNGSKHFLVTNHR